MRKIWIALVVLAGSVSGALAFEKTAEDRYVACVIGNAAVYMHHKATVNEAAEVAARECKALELPGEEPEDGNEGLSDFIYMSLKKLNAPA